MPNRTAIRRGLTRRMPILTIAVVRSKASQLALLSLLVLSASGCGDNSSVTPTPLAPTPPPAPSATVRLEGRVLDEQNQPVQGARITFVSPPGPRPSTTADDAGVFSLTVDWQSHWLGITLRVDREGYEAADVHVQQTAEATREVLITTYRSLTISPGESIQTTVSLGYFACGMVGNLCRRVMVNSRSGELVDLEVVPLDGQKEVGLEKTPFGWGVSLPRRLTVAGGDEVWIVVDEPGRVTVVAADR